MSIPSPFDLTKAEYDAYLTAIEIPFQEFVAEIQKLAEACGATDQGKPYCDAEAWREAFNEGMSPAEAWREECLAAAEMLD